MKVGDTVYVIPIGPNNTRYIKDSILNHIKEGVVEKIGNKYFYLKGWSREKFSIEDMMNVTEYCKDWKVYINKQKIYDKVEYSELLSNIKSKFDLWSNTKFTLDQLRRINAILKEGE